MATENQIETIRLVGQVGRKLGLKQSESILMEIIDISTATFNNRVVSNEMLSDDVVTSIKNIFSAMDKELDKFSNDSKTDYIHDLMNRG